MIMDRGTVKLFSLTECEEIVRKSQKLRTTDDVELLSYGVERGSNDLVGFMGEYYKLNVTIRDKVEGEGEQHLSYFVKSVPISNEFHKAECERKGFFLKETRIYTEILPCIQRYASTQLFPKCYYTRPDVIVLEDLSDSFQHLTSGEEYSIDHYKMVLKHQAKLHAASIAWEMNEGVNIGERFKDVLIEMQLCFWNEWYETGIKGLVFLAKRQQKFPSPKYRKFIDEHLFAILSKAETLTVPSKKLRNVLCHRDSWERNIFYQVDKRGQPIDCRIVDFQLTRYSPPAIDALFFIFTTTTPEKRTAIVGDLLNYYFDTLQSLFQQLHIPDNVVTKKDFDEDVRRARLAVLILWAICEPLMKMPEGLANKMRAEEQEKFDHYMNCERSELFLRVMAIDPTYEATIMRPIDELLNYMFDNEDLYLEILNS